MTNPAFAPAAADLRAQLDDLIYPGWVTATGRRRLPSVLRYARAMAQRLDRLPGDLVADADRMERVARLTAAWRQLADLPPGPARPPTPWPSCAGCWRSSASATSPRRSARQGLCPSSA